MHSTIHTVPPVPTHVCTYNVMMHMYLLRFFFLFRLFASHRHECVWLTWKSKNERALKEPSNKMKLKEQYNRITFCCVWTCFTYLFVTYKFFFLFFLCSFNFSYLFSHSMFMCSSEFEVDEEKRSKKEKKKQNHWVWNVQRSTWIFCEKKHKGLMLNNRIPGAVNDFHCACATKCIQHSQIHIIMLTK